MSLFFCNEEKREFIGFRRRRRKEYKPTTPLILILSFSLPLSPNSVRGINTSCVISAHKSQSHAQRTAQLVAAGGAQTKGDPSQSIRRIHR